MNDFINRKLGDDEHGKRLGQAFLLIGGLLLAVILIKLL